MSNWRTVTAGILACSATLSVALAQNASMTGAQGNWMVHTASKAGCPGLVLHVQRDGDILRASRRPVIWLA
jgi:hypothetical protein